jgi:polysaccharide biosynthesis PFTS motif protein
VDVAFKPKRAGGPMFLQGNARRQLADGAGKWRQSGRLFLFDPDVDPYLPVAVADICVAMPFTSPVAVALNFGKAAFWYDPGRLVNDVYPTDLEQALVRGPERLYARIGALIAGERFSCPPSLLAHVPDPGSAFASVLAHMAGDSAAAA